MILQTFIILTLIFFLLLVLNFWMCYFFLINISYKYTYIQFLIQIFEIKKNVYLVTMVTKKNLYFYLSFRLKMTKLKQKQKKNDKNNKKQTKNKYFKLKLNEKLPL